MKRPDQPPSDDSAGDDDHVGNHDHDHDDDHDDGDGDGDGDGDDFQLPLLGLYADMESGRGSVSLPDEFHARPPGWRLALLQDWVQALMRLQRAAEIDIGTPADADTDAAVRSVAGLPTRPPPG